MHIAKKHILIVIFYMTIAYIALNFELHNNLKKFEHSGLDDESDIEFDIGNHQGEERIILLEKNTLQIKKTEEKETTKVLLAQLDEQIKENNTFNSNLTDIIEKYEFCNPLIYKYSYTS